MARLVGAPTVCAPWGLWIWFKDGRNYETACRFNTAEDAETYARNRLADTGAVERFTLLRRRPGKRERVKMIILDDLSRDTTRKPNETQ